MGLFGGDQTTTTDTWGQLQVSPMGSLESMLRGLGVQASQNLAQGQFGPGLSNADLAANPIFGAQGLFADPAALRAYLQNPSLTPEQKANLTAAYQAAYGALGSQQEQQAQAAAARARLNAEGLVAQINQARASSGVRGTTAGTADLARSLAAIGQGVSGLEGQFAAERSGLAQQQAGGLAGAMVNLPLQQQQLMLSAIDRLLAERQGRLQARGLAQEAQTSLMSNPLIAQALQERLATGRQVGRQTQTQSGGGLGLGGLLGMAASFIPGVGPIAGSLIGGAMNSGSPGSTGENWLGVPSDTPIPGQAGWWGPAY